MLLALPLNVGKLLVSAPEAAVGLGACLGGIWGLQDCPGGSWPRRGGWDVLSRSLREQGLAHGGRGCNGSPPSPLRAPLNNGASFLQWAWLLALVVAVPHSSPFSLSLSSQHQSSPQVCTLNPLFQHPAPTCTSGCALGWGYRAVARTICVGLCVLPATNQLPCPPLKLLFCPS